MAACLTTLAYEHFLDANGIAATIKGLAEKDIPAIEKSHHINVLISNCDLPRQIGEEISSFVLDSNERSAWAVRSSSDMEDLPEASFAGLYESYLNVMTLSEIEAAIKKCWMSLWSEKAFLYRERLGIGQQKASMAVLIQTMVSSTYAGVLYTRDPLGGDSRQMVGEYCVGTAEGLMAGHVRPVSFAVDKLDMSVRQKVPPDLMGLSEQQISGAARVAWAIEEAFGRPQDVEWAIEGEHLHILQTRPITATNDRRPVGLESSWTRANIGEVLPGPVTPLTWAVFSAILLNRPLSSISWPQATANEGDCVRLIEGRAYLRVDTFLDSFCWLPHVTPDVMGQVLGLKLQHPYDLPYMRPSGLKIRCAQIIFLLAAFGILRRSFFRLPDRGDRKRGSAPDIRAMVDRNTMNMRFHVKCTVYAAGAFALIDTLLRRWMKEEETRELLPLILISQGEIQTACQGLSLLEIADYANKHAAVRSLILKSRDWRETADQLRVSEEGDRFLSLLQDFLVANGARTAAEFELAVPRWREDPSFVLGMIKEFLHSCPSASRELMSDRQARQEEALRRLSRGLSPIKRKVFRRVLLSYRSFSSLRENMKYWLMEGYADIRDHYISVGKRLSGEGILMDGNDIFYLVPSEIDALLNGSFEREAARIQINERKEEYNRQEKMAVPQLIVDGGHAEVESFPADALRGVACSPGMAEGRARVLLDISERDLLVPGEILVAPHTDPGWTPLFLLSKAVVTEIGGFLSHGATVAREYGIPAVANVAEVTRKIKTGDKLRVDGTRGTVTLVRE
jgi:pyruvate,water dikinase